ncbi:MAG: hypothetical protein D3904_07445 [Candidatus Electrothrix sp. EH2]|nr:hypothetical protein [Candidatus Electrothrix sp. EH2]
MDTLQTFKQTGIILILLTLTACARNQPWRDINSIDNDCIKCASESTDSLDKSCIIESIEDDNGKILYKLGFLEFTDRGNLFDNQARDDLLKK